MIRPRLMVLIGHPLNKDATVPPHHPYKVFRSFRCIPPIPWTYQAPELFPDIAVPVAATMNTVMIVIVANLGSVGLDAPFHHLVEGGNAGIFIVSARPNESGYPIGTENSPVDWPWKYAILLTTGSPKESMPLILCRCYGTWYKVPGSSPFHRSLIKIKSRRYSF